MSNVIVLPCNARTLNAVRGAINARARVTYAPESKRLHAFGVALAWLRQGASSGWATQAAVQDLRGCAPELSTGPRAA